MLTDEIAHLGVHDLRNAYSVGALKPEEVVSAVAKRIEALDPAIGAFATLRLDEAIDESKKASKALRSQEAVGPLHGIPVAVKELFDIGGLLTSYGSLVFKDHKPAKDAEAVARLRAAGAIIIGSTRTHEFAWGITCQHRDPCRGPQSLEPNARAGWLEWWFGGGRRRWTCPPCHRDRYRRVCPDPGLLLRCRWFETDVRSHLYERGSSTCSDVGPRRRVCAK